MAERWRSWRARWVACSAALGGWLEAGGRTRATAWSTALVLLLGIVDYVTGFEVSFAFMYLVPVALTAWFAGHRPAVFVGVLASFTWHVANSLAGQTNSHVVITYWNALTRLAFFLVVAYLLARLRELLRSQESLASTDPLTGVANARAFHIAAEAERVRLERYGRPLTVVYLDLDEFKSVNDRFGHSAGDEVLRGTARAIQGQIRTCDVLARLGGDEFALLLPETDCAAARALLDRIREGVDIETSSGPMRVRASAGAATYLDSRASVREMIRQADDLMYRAKRAGTDGIEHQTFGGPIADAVLIPHPPAPAGPTAAQRLNEREARAPRSTIQRGHPGKQDRPDAS